MDVTTDHAGPASAKSSGALGRRRVRVGAVVAVALALGFVLWLVLRDGDSSSTPAPPAASKPVPVSPKGLRSLAALGIPIYWAGDRAGTTYELTKTSDNRVFLRYLPAGEKLGTSTPYLTIASYPMKNAFAATQRLARAAGSVALPVGHGGVAFYSRARPANVYLAYPGSAAQVEVYDPSPGAAQQLVFSGQVVPAARGESSTPTVAKAVSPAALGALASSLGHPVYWARSIAGSTYELTQTWSGILYLRYLPKGAAVGTKKPYLTVVTYPVLDALAAVRRTAKSATARSFDLPGGGLAVIDDRDPRNVHLAYPGSDYQVEVFDPSPARALSVARHRIAPVG